MTAELREGLTFDDVLLVPAASDILPRDTEVTTQLTRAIRLGSRADPPDVQSRLAHAICRDHLAFFGMIAAFAVLQLLAW